MKQEHESEKRLSRMKKNRIGVWTCIILLAGLLNQARAAETVLADYFDVQTQSGPGTEVCGRINLLANKDAHHERIPASYQFELVADPASVSCD